jgi:glycosyltransferase involved in cell wall biosynthesis
MAGFLLRSFQIDTMKICFLIQNLAMGGVMRQISILAGGLSRRGHDISVLALYPVDEKWRLVWNLPTVEVSTLMAKKPSVAKAPAELAGAAIALRKFLQREKTQILYAYEGNVARFIAWLASVGLAETKLVWGVQGAGQRNIREDYDWKLALPFYICKWISGFVPALISNSEAGYRDRKDRGYRCPRQLFIDNGFEVDRFKPDAEGRARVREEWNIGNEYLIGVVGRVAPSKGIPNFLKAAALLRQKRTDVRFACVGSGAPEYIRKLRRLAEELGIAEIVTWGDAREDVVAVYNALDILSLSAYGGEGFPNVIGEAMACGVPCVVTDVGDSRKIVGDMGLVVPPEDSQSLAEGMDAMLRRLDFVDKLQVRARIVDRFPLEAMIAKTEGALNDTVNE